MWFGLFNQKHVTISGRALFPTPDAYAFFTQSLKPVSVWSEDILGTHFVLISNLIVLSFKLEKNQRARLLLFLFGSLIRCTLNTASK